MKCGIAAFRMLGASGKTAPCNIRQGWPKATPCRMCAVVSRRGAAAGYVPLLPPPIGLMSGRPSIVLLTVSYPSSVKVTVYSP